MSVALVCKECNAVKHPHPLTGLCGYCKAKRVPRSYKSPKKDKPKKRKWAPEGPGDWKPVHRVLID